MVVAVDELFVGFESGVDEETFAVSEMIVPAGVVTIAVNCTGKLADAPEARLAMVQVIVPVPPTAGTVPHVHPAGGVMDWKFVFGGVLWVKLTPVAAAGPLFVTLWV